MKVRADELLVQLGLAPTRSKARALIMAGQVRIGDTVIDKAGTKLERSDAIEVEQGPRFVSRGGEKLQHALTTFGVDPADGVCADFGASTGGFTDALLQAGARRVYAIDVGYGQLDYRLRTHSRVVVMERVNARHLDELSEPVDLVTIDVSFISLRLMFPAVKRVLRPEAGLCIALVKPQFEAGREQVGKGGVVRDPGTHATVLHSVAGYARDNDLYVVDLTRSPIAGPSGNREFLMLLGQTRPAEIDLQEKIEQIIRSSPDSESKDA